MSTMRGFQGDERELMLILTVYSQLRDLNRIKVVWRVYLAVSRGRRLLVVVGSGEALRRSEQWAELPRIVGNELRKIRPFLKYPLSEY